MAHYKIILTYDGTAFSGMQRQADTRTVQAEIEKALRKIGWQGQSILAAGRTDAGVHASGQVIAFDLEWKHPDADLLNALNANLPADAAARGIEQVGDEFHPRFDAISRHYRYELFCQARRDPLRERYAWRVWPKVELETLDQTAKQLVGEHDFSPFGAPPKPGGSTIRHVTLAEWRQENDTLVFQVAANAFLYHMVRRMVSVQVEIAKGIQPSDLIEDYLNGEIQGIIQGLAPPRGLYLTDVVYPQV